MKERFFVHVNGFGDGTAYIHLVSNSSCFLVSKDRARTASKLIDLTYCLLAVDDGSWREITKEEAEGLVLPSLPAEKIKNVWVQYEIGDILLSSTYINSVMKVEPSGILVVEELGGNKQKYTFAPGVWIKTIEYES